jgi:CTP synthase
MSTGVCKHVVVTGGVVSGLGKGIAAASLARLLTARGLRVVLGKMDPYLNVDPGTLAPAEHGETHVLDCGVEVDLDFGHYERFSGATLPAAATITAGATYLDVLTRERRGDYLGATVQVVPHIVDALRDRMLALSHGANIGEPDPDVVILELGGTVGDLESLAFLEAIRRYRKAVGRGNFCLVHLALVPTISTSGEEKTKPAQHSVTELRSRGLTPDVIALRAQRALAANVKATISHLCDVEAEAVISIADAASLYAVPLALHGEGLDDVVCAVLGLETPAPDLIEWRRLVARAENPTRVLRIGIAGKYTHADAYLSVIEALNHAGIECDARAEITFIPTDDLTDETAPAALDALDALVIPGGFGSRGIDGKLAICRAARESELPTLGICLGLHVLVIDVARNLAGYSTAHSTEIDPGTPHPVVSLMEEQYTVTGLGGSLRLGACPCELTPGSKVAQTYGTVRITERHRHRYEVNNAYRAALKKAGLCISGTSPDGSLVECVELSGPGYFVATQAHPEFTSRPDRPHPLFVGLLRAALERADARRAAPAAPLGGEDR